MKQQLKNSLGARLVQIGAVSAIALAATLANADNHRAGGHMNAARQWPVFSNPSEITRTTTLIDREVSDTQGNGLGKVVDIAFNSETGEVGYVVVESDRGSLFNRPKERYIAVPLEHINFVSTGALVIDTSAQQFANLAAFPITNLPMRATQMDSSEETIAVPVAEMADAGEPGGMATVEAMDAPMHATEAFEKLDADADGFLTSEELASDVAQLQAADGNADGKLDQAEFAVFEKEAEMRVLPAPAVVIPGAEESDYEESDYEESDLEFEESKDDQY